MPIRRAQGFDIPQIARIHKLQFSDHFLACYSESLIGKYYAEFLNEFIFLVSCEGNTVNGFVVGGKSEDITSCRTSFLTRNILHIVIETLLRPRIYHEALRRLRYFLRSTNQPALLDVRVGLLSIAVSEDAKGRGVAINLVETFEKNLKDCLSYKLSVMKDNSRGRAFYNKMGFTFAGEGGESIVLVKRLGRENRSSGYSARHETTRNDPLEKEPSRIVERYERRINLPKALYDPLQAYNFMVDREKQLVLAKWANWARLSPVADKKVLEIGSGSGKNLLRLMLLGFRPENLVANDLLEDRVEEARHLLPASTTILLGDAAELDYGDEAFDVVFQSLMFTSILDNSFQEKLAKRMWAMVKRSGGVLWYDYVYNNPKNPDVKGVPVERIRQLFPQGEMKVWKLTLAPPIGRIVTRVSPSLYPVFNAFAVLRTHVLCWIGKV